LKHICNWHSKAHEKYSKKRYVEIYALLEVWEEYPLLEDLEGINALSGLNLHSMVLVTDQKGCVKLLATDSSMQNYFKLEHKGQKFPST